MTSRRYMASAPACALTALAVALSADVVHAETPLSLMVSQSLTYDSNIMKDNANKYRDAFSTTAVMVGFDKEYGRQTYNAAVTARTTKYKNSEQLDNDGYDVQLGFASSIAANWNVAINHYNQKQLQSFEEQSGARYPENIISKVTQGVIRYGIYGRWSTSLTLGRSEADYETINYYDKTSDYGRVGVRYNPTDLMYFDFGVRRTKTDNPKYPLQNGAVIGDPVKRTDYELNSQWIVTGYSRLYGRIGWTQERHSRDSLRDYNGLTGYLRWSYAPTGKTTYSLAIDRDTNNAGGSANEQRGSVTENGVVTPNQLLFGSYTSQNRLTTGIILSVDYKATSKISLNSSLTFKRFNEEERRQLDGVLTGGAQSLSTSKSGDYKSFSLGVNYQIHRIVGLGCNLEKYERSASLFNREFDGEQLACSVSLSFD